MNKASQKILRELGMAPFKAHPLFESGTAQTIVPSIMPIFPSFKRQERLEIPLEDGDILVASVDRPADFHSGQRVVLLVHGLVGDENSPYMLRLSKVLTDEGLLVVRLNLRGCGPGFGKAKFSYHSGRSEDTRAVIKFLSKKFPKSPVTQVGFSLGANITLKMAGEDGARPSGSLDSVIAVSSPLDLSASGQKMKNFGRFFDQFFVWKLRSEIRRLHKHFADLPPTPQIPLRLSLSDFDGIYTAPMNGFRDAEDYYRQSSAGQFIPQIKIRGLSIFSLDDPVIDTESYLKQVWPENVSSLITQTGGHVGFLSGNWQSPWWFNDVIKRWILAL